MLFNYRILMFVMLSGEAEEAVLSGEGADPQLVTRLPESKPEEQSVSKAETILTATFWVYEIL